MTEIVVKIGTWFLDAYDDTLAKPRTNKNALSNNKNFFFILNPPQKSLQILCHKNA